MKLELIYPLGYSDCSYYKSLVENPPIEIISSTEKHGVQNKTKFILVKILKSKIRLIINKLNLNLINFKKIKSDADIVHCAHFLCECNKPWIADFEMPWQFFVSGKITKTGIKKVEKIMNSKNFKRIICWTKYGQKEVRKLFKSKKIKRKIDFVYPAITPQIKVNHKTKKINLLFVSRYFEEKGGELALESINKLTEKNNVFGTIISNTPNEIKMKYLKNKKIKFYDLTNQKKLFKIYSKANILILPGFSDTFGFAFLEAMSFGIPIITINGPSRKEIITPKTGIIIKKYRNKEKIVKEIIKASEKLIKNQKLRIIFGKNAYNEIKYGKFSIKKRNEKLLKIYKEASK